LAGYTTTVKNALLTTAIAQGTWISAHTGDPGTTGGSEVAGGSYGRVQTTWGTPAGADQSPSTVTGSSVVFSIPASTAITHWGLWSDQTTGNWVTGGSLPATAVYGITSGIYTLTPVLSQAG
jgi:hypothetical protein